MEFEIISRLSVEELHNKLSNLRARYQGKQVTHVSSGDKYIVTDVVVINSNGTAHFGLEYSPVINGEYYGFIVHVIPLHEYLEIGRFKSTK